MTNDDSYRMTFFPMRWLIVTNVIQVTMWWVGICLAVMRQTWNCLLYTSDAADE